ncbi:MAG: hypothetical protein RMY62_019995 [Nostoc sp. ZfuVER08]
MSLGVEQALDRPTLHRDVPLLYHEMSLGVEQFTHSAGEGNFEGSALP